MAKSELGQVGFSFQSPSFFIFRRGFEVHLNFVLKIFFPPPNQQKLCLIFYVFINRQMHIYVEAKQALSRRPSSQGDLLIFHFWCFLVQQNSVLPPRPRTQTRPHPVLIVTMCAKYSHFLFTTAVLGREESGRGKFLLFKS